MPERVEELASGGVHDAAFQIIRSLPGNYVLDAPAGQGALTKRLLSIGREVTAGDIDLDKFKLDRNMKNLEVRRLDLSDTLPIEDERFDIVACLEGIEHLENQWNLIRSFYRVLKKGGYLVLSTPNIINFRSRIRFLLEARYEFFKRPLVVGRSTPHDEEVGHIAPISYFELQYILESCGFSIRTLHANKYSSRNILSMLLRPLFRFSYVHKNRRDKKRNRGEFMRLYDVVMSDELFYGETLIVLAQKPA